MKNKFKVFIVFLFGILVFCFISVTTLAKSMIEEYSGDDENVKSVQLIESSHSISKIEQTAFTEDELKDPSIPDSNSQVSLLSNEPVDSFVSGRLTWREIENEDEEDEDQPHTFPLKNTLVRIKYTSTTAGATFPQFVYTDENGEFFATIKLAEPQDVSLQIHSEGKTVIVKNNSLATSYSARSKSMSLNPGGAISFIDCINDITADVTTQKAFQVCQALIMGGRYVVAMTGEVFPSVTCHYPKNGSYYDSFSDVISIAEGAYSYWDIILHEFGHKVQQHYGITDNPGGNHFIDEDLIERYNKDTGIKMAWGEGWATFFGILVIQYFGDELVDLERINDEEYNSFNPDDGSPWGLSLEAPSIFPPVFCEGNELSVAAALYDLYDSYSESEPWDTISFSHKEMFNAVVQSGATTFSEFLNYFVNNYYSANDGAIGRILTQHGMASTNLKISSDTLSASTPPTFSWEAGGQNSCKFNEFQLVFYNSNQVVTLLTTERQTGTTLTLTSEQWNRILEVEAIKFYVAVISYQTSSPSTGPYYSTQLEVLRPADAPHIHIYSYKSINSIVHQVTCRCGESYQQSHYFLPERLGQRCKYCSYYANGSVIIPGIKNVNKNTREIMYLEKKTMFK